LSAAAWARGCSAEEPEIWIVPERLPGAEDDALLLPPHAHNEAAIKEAARITDKIFFILFIPLSSSSCSIFCTLTIVLCMPAQKYPCVLEM
jgi:hypothetical protein